MDLGKLVDAVTTQCALLSEKADTVIKRWGKGKELEEQRQDGSLTLKDLLNGLWENRLVMQNELGRLSFEMGILHTSLNGALMGLEYTDAKKALLERVLQPMMDTQADINRAQSAADMVTLMLKDALEG